MGKIVGGTITTPINAYTRKQMDNKFSEMTPQKGVDYWTEEDKAEIKAYVDEAILGGEW